GAVEAQRAAVTMRPAFPEAWNELGFALRNQGRYAESLQAYDAALRLRPNSPEALEYLGEAYVKLGRLDDARRVLDRLRPLDTARAGELAEVIQKGKEAARTGTPSTSRRPAPTPCESSRRPARPRPPYLERAGSPRARTATSRYPD